MKKKSVSGRCIPYHHFAVNNSKDLGEGPIFSLIINQPIHRFAHHLIINSNSIKLLSMAEHSHYKSRQPLFGNKTFYN